MERIGFFYAPDGGGDGLSELRADAQGGALCHNLIKHRSWEPFSSGNRRSIHGTPGSSSPSASPEFTGAGSTRRNPPPRGARSSSTRARESAAARPSGAARDRSPTSSHS